MTQVVRGCGHLVRAHLLLCPGPSPCTALEVNCFRKWSKPTLLPVTAKWGRFMKALGRLPTGQGLLDLLLG